MPEWASINKPQNYKGFVRTWRNSNPLTEWVEMQNAKLVTWNIGWWFFIKLNTHLAHNPAIPLLGICPREMQTQMHTKPCLKQLYT